MTARLRVRRHDGSPKDYHHAEQQWAQIMAHAARTDTPLFHDDLDPEPWICVHWNPAKVRVAGERAGVRS